MIKTAGPGGYFHAQGAQALCAVDNWFMQMPLSVVKVAIDFFRVNRTAGPMYELNPCCTKSSKDKKEHYPDDAKAEKGSGDDGDSLGDKHPLEDLLLDVKEAVGLLFSHTH